MPSIRRPSEETMSAPMPFSASRPIAVRTLSDPSMVATSWPLRRSSWLICT
jgi:hypothetical protein